MPYFVFATAHQWHVLRRRVKGLRVLAPDEVLPDSYEAKRNAAADFMQHAATASSSWFNTIVHLRIFKANVSEFPQVLTRLPASGFLPEDKALIHPTAQRLVRKWIKVRARAPLSWCRVLCKAVQ